MHIAELQISDLRSFAGQHHVSLEHSGGSFAGWTVFAGRNGAGKSTLLKAIALSAIGPLASRSLAGVFNGWVRSGTQEARVATLLNFDPRYDKFKGQGGRTTKTPFWTALSWTPVPHSANAVNRWMDIEKPNRRGIPDRGPWADAPDGWFIAGYGPYRHLGPAPAEVLKLTADPVMARLVNLFNEAATLSEAVDWLKQVHVRALEARIGAEELKRAVLGMLDDGLLPDGSSVRDVDSDGLWIKRDLIEMPLEQVSDGYRTVAALVVDILRRLHESYGQLSIAVHSAGHKICPLPGVVLIDEVDAHMHVAWQQRIGFWLTSRFPNIQFLVTTHSPFICQAASEGGIIRLPAPGEKRKIEHVDPDTFKAVVHGGADDAVMTELFGLEHAHSSISEDLRRELSDLEALVIRGAATARQLEQYNALKSSVMEDIGELADRKLRSVLRQDPS
ncbi:AAA family ATPase [Burkholderia glumae]|uniref:AAA family ATPase n=1 Tax=Burkholderia glumae TaxID=337 RepID=UPI002151CE76|nr:AAA family ATPase [Burkholderia glumae]